jgi:hypothetical protein
MVMKSCNHHARCPVPCGKPFTDKYWNGNVCKQQKHALVVNQHVTSKSITTLGRLLF